MKSFAAFVGTCRRSFSVQINSNDNCMAEHVLFYIRYTSPKRSWGHRLTLDTQYSQALKYTRFLTGKTVHYTWQGPYHKYETSY